MINEGIILPKAGVIPERVRGVAELDCFAGFLDFLSSVDNFLLFGREGRFCGVRCCHLMDMGKGPTN